MMCWVSAVSPGALYNWIPLVTLVLHTPSRYTITRLKSVSVGSVQTHVIEVGRYVLFTRPVTLRGAVVTGNGAVLAVWLTQLAFTLPMVSTVPGSYDVLGISGQAGALYNWIPLVTLVLHTPSRYTITRLKSVSVGSVQTHVIEVGRYVLFTRQVTLRGAVVFGNGAVLAV